MVVRWYTKNQVPLKRVKIDECRRKEISRLSVLTIGWLTTIMGGACKPPVSKKKSKCEQWLCFSPTLGGPRKEYV